MHTSFPEFFLAQNGAGWCRLGEKLITKKKKRFRFLLVQQLFDKYELLSLFTMLVFLWGATKNLFAVSDVELVLFSKKKNLWGKKFISNTFPTECYLAISCMCQSNWDCFVFHMIVTFCCHPFLQWLFSHFINILVKHKPTLSCQFLSYTYMREGLTTETPLFIIYKNVNKLYHLP